MDIEKARKIQRGYYWFRWAIIGASLALGAWLTRAEAAEPKATINLHGLIRGKYEYQPQMDASRFELRNARISVDGKLPLRSAYKLEVDFCDETQIKLKDAWVQVNPWRTLKASIGQIRMPFSIDAHRNPQARYFANRSFIAKQVGDVRDVGLVLSYSFLHDEKPWLVLDGGIFNGSNLDNQKFAWHTDWNYSARIQWFPVEGLAVIPSVQHQAIAERKAHYTSFDLGAFYEHKGFHIEAEYLRKHYSDGVFSDCAAWNTLFFYEHALKTKRPRPLFLSGLRYLLRYDYMDDHSDGKQGFDVATGRLLRSDCARHRWTAGITLKIDNKFCPTELRFNYEKYLYPHAGTPKESEQDKLVAELMIRF